jgi:hypothetical protein
MLMLRCSDGQKILIFKNKEKVYYGLQKILIFKNYILYNGQMQKN